jgi:hypothetical protein
MRYGMGLDEETLKKLASSGLPGSRVSVTNKASDDAHTPWFISALAWRLLKEGSVTTFRHSLETQEQRTTSLVGSLRRISRTISEDSGGGAGPLLINGSKPKIDRVQRVDDRETRERDGRQFIVWH